MSTAPTPTLSVVIVTRNEAEHIEDCLSSVFDLCSDGPPFEVILVDSNSTDNTVALASEYPITILRIPDDDIASPGAGRYVGTHHASGDYLLFVDGDMEVVDGWLDDALELVQRKSIAGVTGHLNETTLDAPTTPVGEATEPAVTRGVMTEPERRDVTMETDSAPASTLADGGVTHLTTHVDGWGARDEREIRDVDALRGIALYDADILESVGGFDPHLHASEDTDVGYQIRSDGYYLVQLPYVVAKHPEPGSLSHPFRRWRRGYFLGVGQSLRKGADNPTVIASYLLALRHPLLAAAWGCFGFLIGIRSRRTLFGWVAITTIAVGAYSSRSDARTTIIDATSYLFTLLGVVVGWWRPPPPPEDYPIEKVEVVTSGPCHA